MAIGNILTMTRRGMIIIPKKYRERYHFTGGSEFGVLDLDGLLTLIPIIPLDQLRNDLIPHDQLISTIEEDRERELEIEK